MRKWMRERLKRRKNAEKPVASSDTRQAPLQPAYFDAHTPEAKHTQAALPPEPHDEPSEEGAAGPGAQDATGAGASADNTQRRRRRRGRGGRGRRRAAAVPASPEVAAEPSAPPVPEPPPAPAARPSKGLVVLAIGLPGSGKSSWFKRHNIVPLSSDTLRAWLFDDPNEQRFQDLVFSNLRSMLKARLIARRPMNYVDATNLTPNERHNWIKLAKDYGYEVQAVFFDVPLEVCLERHKRRQRVVEEEVMRRMAGKLRPPTFEEGFTKITVVRVKKKDNEIAS